jgi:hypothetical protein
MLHNALTSRATRIDVLGDVGAVRWLRGDVLVATAELPEGAFSTLADELCAIGAKRNSTNTLTVQSPGGPLTFSVAIAPKSIGFVLRTDEQLADEEAFSELMTHLDSIAADHVTCANGEAKFWEGKKALQIVPLVDGAIASLVRHGKLISGIEGDDREGGGVLFGGKGPRILRVELVDGGIAFTVSEQKK